MLTLAAWTRVALADRAMSGADISSLAAGSESILCSPATAKCAVSEGDGPQPILVGRTECQLGIKLLALGVQYIQIAGYAISILQFGQAQVLVGCGQSLSLRLCLQF